MVRPAEVEREGCQETAPQPLGVAGEAADVPPSRLWAPAFTYALGVPRPLPRPRVLRGLPWATATSGWRCGSPSWRRVQSDSRTRDEPGIAPFLDASVRESKSFSRCVCCAQKGEQNRGPGWDGSKAGSRRFWGTAARPAVDSTQRLCCHATCGLPVAPAAHCDPCGLCHRLESFVPGAPLRSPTTA